MTTNNPTLGPDDSVWPEYEQLRDAVAFLTPERYR